MKRFFSDAPGHCAALMTPLCEAEYRRRHSRPPLLSSAGTSARLCSPRPHITSHLFETFLFLPTPHPVSCITLLQSLFWAQRDPGTHQMESCPCRPQPVWIAAPSDWVRERRSSLPARKKNQTGEKKKKSGYFSFLSILSILSVECSVLLAGKCMF